MPSPTTIPTPLPALPHTAPFRLVDRIVWADVESGQLVAERRLTLNDALWPAESQSSSYFFSPAPAAGTAPPFPPTLLIEALCQAAACLNSLRLHPAPPAAPGSPALMTDPKPPKHHGMLVAIRDLKFPAFAYVGQTLSLHVQQKEQLGPVIAFAVTATATGDGAQPRQVASGRLLFALTLA